MNSPAYREKYMATLKTTIKNDAKNYSANVGTPALKQYTSGISGGGYVPYKKK